MPVAQAAPSKYRPTAVLATALIAFALVACGDSEDPPEERVVDATGATSAPTDRQPPEQRSDDPPREGREPTTPVDPGAGTTPPDAGARTGPSGPPDEPPADGQEEQQVAAVAAEMYDAFGAGDGRRVCAVLTERARRQIVETGPGDATCDERLSSFLKASGTAALRQIGAATIGDVQVSGDEAQVTVSLGGKRSQIPLIREHGNWRFGSVATPVAPGS